MLTTFYTSIRVINVNLIDKFISKLTTKHVMYKLIFYIYFTKKLLSPIGLSSFFAGKHITKS